MHFEVLVEGQSELTALSIWMEKIVGPYENPHTWKIHKHRGIGKLPVDPAQPANRRDPTLLHNLPSKLRAYGKAMGRDEMVVVLVDLDDRPDCRAFKRELAALLAHCAPSLNCLLRIAIEELESWFLGDPAALREAFPHVNMQAIHHYEQDSQCGTWEMLAEAVHPGGMKTLASTGKRSPQLIKTKTDWAKAIARHMDVERNASPSFQCFRDGLRKAVAPT